MALRVLVVSEVRIVREGVRAVLAARDGIDIVSTVDSQHAGVQCAELQPQIALFDAARRDSVEFVKDILTRAPDCKVVAFGVRETAEDILPWAAAGTAGYVHACATGGEVASVLEQVMRGELPCSARAAAALYREVATLSRWGGGRPRERGAVMLRLSRRELQIARLIERGLTNKQIARVLCIEPATVKNHVHNLCEKLRVHRRGAAVARLRLVWHPRAPLPAAAPDPEAALAKGR